MPTRQQRRAASRDAAKSGGSPRSSRSRWIVLGIIVVAGGLGVWWWGRGAAPGTGDRAAAPAANVTRDGAPSWAPDSRHIAYYSEIDGKGKIFVAAVDGTDRRQLTTGSTDDGGPVYSPDGTRIAFDSDRDGNFEIYVMQSDGQGVTRLTTHPGRDVAPAWSPDGTKIAFMSNRDNPEFDIYEMNADGSGVRRLTTGSSNWFPQYSPDGTRIATHRMRDVHVMTLATGAIERLTQEPFNGMYPSWSPDGRKIAFMSWRNGPTELYTMNADGSDQQMIVTMPRGDAVDPRWSPDGERLLFVHVPEGGLQGPQTGSQERIIYVVELKSGEKTRVSR